MDDFDKLKFLSEQTSFEPDGEPRVSDSPPACFTPKEKDHAFIHPAQLPGGQKMLLLKSLLTSACECDCFYYRFRAVRNFSRATFKPNGFDNVFEKRTTATRPKGV